VTLQRGNGRPKLSHLDRLFWVAVRRLWSKWKQALVIVNPETVVRWHRTGFRLYWSWLSGHQKAFGRKRISKEVRDLIFRMAAENPTWGAPRIHGELLKLGFDVSEPSRAGYIKHRRTHNRRNAGRPSWRITGRLLPRWISSPFQPSLSVCCTASSSSRMIAGGFCELAAVNVFAVNLLFTFKEAPAHLRVPA